MIRSIVGCIPNYWGCGRYHDKIIGLTFRLDGRETHSDREEERDSYNGFRL